MREVPSVVGLSCPVRPSGRLARARPKAARSKRIVPESNDGPTPVHRRSGVLEKGHEGDNSAKPAKQSNAALVLVR